MSNASHTRPETEVAFQKQAQLQAPSSGAQLVLQAPSSGAQLQAPSSGAQLVLQAPSSGAELRTSLIDGRDACDG